MPCSPWLSCAGSRPPPWWQQRQQQAGQQARDRERSYRHFTTAGSSVRDKKAGLESAGCFRRTPVFVSTLPNPGWRSPRATAARTAAQAASRAAQEVATGAAVANKLQQHEASEAAVLGAVMREAAAAGELATVREAIAWTSRSGKQKVDLDATGHDDRLHPDTWINSDGGPAIYRASRRSHVQIVVDLLRAGAAPPTVKGYTAEQFCKLANDFAAEKNLLGELEARAQAAEQAVITAESGVHAAENGRTAKAKQLAANEQDAQALSSVAAKCARKR